MKLLALLTAFFIFSSLAIAADSTFAKTVSWIDIPVDENRISSQDGIPYGCGYVAIYNALMIRGTEGKKIVDSLPGKTPTEKINYIIRTYGAEQSAEYPHQKRQRET